jgi:Fur family ferric uptake transcriptional regulator
MKGSSTPSNRSRLRGVGLRVTAPRLAVLDALAQIGRPATHGEVVERVTDGGWDRATIYRNLVDLADAGLLVRSDLGDHLWRFTLADDGPHVGHHPHFVCTACGDVACLPPVLLPVSGPGVPTAVRVGHVEVQVRGLCDGCTPAGPAS